MPGSTQCPHSDVHFNLKNVGFADTNIHYLEITGRCALCDKKLTFRGCPLGVSPAHPTMTLGGEEIRIPFLCEGEEPTGNQIGFTGRMIDHG